MFPFKSFPGILRKVIEFPQAVECALLTTSNASESCEGEVITSCQLHW